MKLNKTLGRIATTFLATAMLAGLTAVPASAATIGADGKASDESGISAITFTNALILPENVPMPTTDLTFELTGIAGGVTVNDGSHSITTETGTGTYTGKITFNSSATEDKSYSVEGIDRYTMDVTIDLKDESDTALSFEQPGVYAYKLSETTLAPNADWTMAKDLYVYLYVTRDLTTQEVKITGVSTSTDANSVTVDTAKQNTMTNYYQVTEPTNPGDNPTVKDNKITISNKIDGAMGDRTDSYNFTVSITGTAGKTYTAVYVNSSNEVISSKGPVQISANTPVDIPVGHDERLQINGLSNGEGFSVTEKEANENNYATSIVTNIASKESISGPDAAQAVTGTFNGNVTMAFTNTREAVTPTGLVMNVAPYVLLVLVAAGAGYVFLRKREED